MKLREIHLMETLIPDLDEVCELIKKECQPFLKVLADSDGDYLYRGVRGLTQPSFTVHPQGRAPKDSTQEFHDFFNDCTKHAFGIEKIRNHTIFVTGSTTMAKGYGDLNIIFPKGDFKYMWSETILDSFLDSALGNYSREPLKELGYPHSLNFNILVKHWDKGTLAAYLGDLSRGRWKHPDKVIRKAIMDYFKSLYRLDGLSTAIKSYKNNEVLIYESDGYYMVPVDMIEEDGDFRNRLGL